LCVNFGLDHVTAACLKTPAIFLNLAKELIAFPHVGEIGIVLTGLYAYPAWVAEFLVKIRQAAG